jgi:hypothetical protein
MKNVILKSNEYIQLKNCINIQLPVYREEFPAKDQK